MWCSKLVTAKLIVGSGHLDVMSSYAPIFAKIYIVDNDR